MFDRDGFGPTNGGSESPTATFLAKILQCVKTRDGSCNVAAEFPKYCCWP